jgi:ABC-type phosphate/phosphonate transport system substrate-binding protein
MKLRFRYVLAALSALWIGQTVNAEAGADASIGPFRIGIALGTPGPCAVPTNDAGAEALAGHLNARLKRPVEICRFATTAEAGAALASNQVDFALLDQANAPDLAQARALVTPRPDGSIGRIMSVVAAPKSSSIASLNDIAGTRAVFAGQGAAFISGPKTAISDNGGPIEALASETIEATPEQAVERVRTGEGDILVTHVAAWQRLCRGAREGDEPCADFKVVWMGRERAKTAWALRADADRDTLYRLAGILLALNLENPAAFAWMAPGAVELTPVEAGALSPTGSGP